MLKWSVNSAFDLFWLVNSEAILLKFTIHLWAEILNIFNNFSVYRQHPYGTTIYLHFQLVNCQLITVGVIVAAAVVFVDRYLIMATEYYSQLTDWSWL